MIKVTDKIVLGSQILKDDKGFFIDFKGMRISVDFQQTTASKIKVYN